ncbi:NUDIX domain-containing protein [Pseudoclavibacter chungangensis]|nr:NUDIX domain-containing protein [Pseudoclavibacter chungangensis]
MIRNIALGLVVRDGFVLGEEYPARSGHELFVRVPGGGIDYGEHSVDAVRREFAEELAVEVREARLLGVLESHFMRGERVGHEYAHVFAVTSPDLDAWPIEERRPVLDSDTVAGWFPLEALAAGRPPLYPDGAVAFAERLRGHTATNR